MPAPGIPKTQDHEVSKSRNLEASKSRSLEIPKKTKTTMLQKNSFWSVVLQIAITVLTAISTTLGVTSCI